MKSQQDKDKVTASKSPGRTTTAAQGKRTNETPPQKTNSPEKISGKAVPNFQKPQTTTNASSSRSVASRNNQDLNASTSTNRKSITGAPPKPSNQSQKIVPKGKTGQKKPDTSGNVQKQASRSTRDLSEMAQSQKSPLKGILKKPKDQMDDSISNVNDKRARFAASAQSDDEQIRKINFQHQLDMAHKERRQGFFPEEEKKEEDVPIVNTDSKTLGFSLLTNSVNQRTGEVDLNTYSLKPPPGMDNQKPINYKNLDWSFKEFMKVQEDMIAKGQIDPAIKNLEDALNERLAIYPAKDEGVWRLTQLLADVTIKTAVRHLNNNKADESINYLKQAMKCTEPLPNSDWSENAEWVSLRKSVFKNLALYHQKKEDWNKALANFKHSLKLDQSPINPDVLGAANTSLTCAVILSKLNKYAESIDYAESCMKAIEDLAQIDRAMPLSEYKQKIQKNGTKANGGKLQEHDKMMTTYAISLHLLGNNLANLKYGKEAKVLLQRAQYVASHLTSTPRQELAQAITNDISNLIKKEGKKQQLGGKVEHLPTNEETDSALQSIKTNLANHAYSLAADFEEQKALLDELVQKEDDKANQKSRYDDKALEYVKQFIEEKKKQEKGAIDEYRAKIAKDFDTKQNEFLAKQQRVKKQNALKEEMKQKKKGDFAVKKPGAMSSAGESETDQSVVGKKIPPRGGISRSAGIPETSIKAGDFQTEEQRGRVKKSEKNLAAEGAKLDNMGLKYSADRGKKQFFNKRRMNIEKVNEKLGYFGGGILDQPKDEEVVLEGGAGGSSNSPRSSKSPRFNRTGLDSTAENPFERENHQALANQSLKKSGGAAGDQTATSPRKKTRGQKEREELEKSGVKLPPVQGYKLDTLSLGELGETVVKKSMDMGYGSDNPFKRNGYKNPQTRKLLETIENKDYGSITRGKSFKNEKASDQKQAEGPPKIMTEAERLEREHLKTLENQNSGQIRDIPTYVPPPEKKDSDWRDDYKKNQHSDEELPDTKLLIAKLNKLQQQKPQNSSVFEEVDERRREDFIKDDLDDLEIERIKQKLRERELAKAAQEAAKTTLPQVPVKPPKSKNQMNTTSSDQGSTRLPVIKKKNFQEDRSPSTSPDRQDTISPNKAKANLSPPSKKQTSPKQGVETSPQQSKSGKVSLSNRKSLLPSPSVGKKTVSSKDAAQVEQEKPPAAGYVPPNKRLTRSQKLLLEQKQKEEDEKKGKKKVQKNMEVEEGQQMKRGFDEDRLASLSTPKSLQPTPKATEAASKKGAKSGDDKAKELIDKVDKGKALDLANYLDRDVPAINNQTKKKLSKNQSDENNKGDDSSKPKDFDTSINNRPGLFTTLGQNQDGGSGTQSGHRSGRNSAKLSRSQSTQGAAAAGGKLASTQEGGNDEGNTEQKQRAISEGRGLLYGLEMQKNGGLTVQGLRIIEKKAASTIQRFIRGYFTKKWYLNYMMRQKLGVPFSGMEFAQNVFLRAFNKPNQQLHQAAMVPPQIVEAVQSTNQLKNMSQKQFRHGKGGSGPPGLLTDADLKKNRSPLVPKRLRKGTTPQQLMNEFQNQFVAKGLDAYSQFRSYGIDALTDDNGNPTFKSKDQIPDDEKPLDPDQVSPRTINVALDPLERMVPRWRGRNVERFIEVKEVGDYLDRVSRVKEYEEKQRDIMKVQQYRDQAKQLRRHEVTTMASFAKAQGVFNRNPNKRNTKEDDEDYDPLQPGKQQDIPMDGGDPGDDPGDNGSGSEDENGNKKKYDPGKPIRNLAFKEEDGSIPLKMYQQFSREMIVFYKKVNGVPIKWTVQAGIPFVKDRKQYIPVRIYGELQNSRHLMVSYIMNLELLKISADYYQYNTHQFETIWPFILYLFNNWVRYQVQLIHLTDNKPLFGPEEFLAPREITQEQQNELGKLHQQNSGLQGLLHQNDYSFQVTKGMKKGEVLQDTSDPLYNPNIEDLMDLKEGIKLAKQDYDEALNFSSEIEYDERFDQEIYKTLVKPDELLDRSAPKERRTSAAQIMADNRRQLFQAYRMQLQEEKKKDPLVGLLEVGSSPNKESEKNKHNLLYQMESEEEKKLIFDEMGRPRKKVRLKLDDIYEPINISNMNPFARFLNLHFVSLPASESGQYKLLRSLQMKGYNERQNTNIPYQLANINRMNEERRRRNNLLPLSVTDYNCIDRAALKLKLILDCLYLKRQINGMALVPRDVKIAYIDQEWQRRKLRNLRITSKLAQFSLELVKAFGEHIVYAKAYNNRQIEMDQSIKKIDEYKSRKQLHSIIAMADINNKEQNKLNSALQGIKNVPKVNIESLNQYTRNNMVHQDQDEAEAGYQGLSEQAIMMSRSKIKEGKNLGDTSTIIINPDDLKLGLVEDTRNNRIKQAMAHLNGNSTINVPQEEFREEPPMEIHGFNDAGIEPDIQDYVHDGQIFEQGIIRIRGNLYICTLVFKKILSNFENMKSLIEDRIKVHAPKSLTHQVEMQKSYKGHLRLKSKLCAFVSTHDDVVNFDNEVYRLIKPTEKIMLESEMSTKERTKYKTYLEVKINTKMSDTIWDDCFNLQWERLYDFFQIFGIKWRLHDLIVKRRFSFRDRFVFFNFFGMSLSIRDTLLEYEPAAIDFNNFKYYNIFLKQDSLKAFRTQFGHMPFYFDDFIDPQKQSDFDECAYDNVVNPYYNIGKAQNKIEQKLNQKRKEGIVFDPADLHPERMALYQDDKIEEEDDDAMIQGIHVIINEERKKPGLLVDDATREYLIERRDHTNMFNLTLTNFPQSDGLFLGRVMLGNAETYRTPLNLRIDYYSVGFVPILQIKAYNAIYSESFEIKIGHKPTIKSFIRICNQSNQAMIINQLQSAITIGRKVLGRYIRLNFNKHHLYITSGVGTRHGQDFMNMAICNENLIRTMLNDNYRQFSGVMYFDNLGGRNLVTITEFEIDMYQQVKGNQSMIHMNKHLSLEEKKDQEQVDAQNSLPMQKRYQKVKLWKINIFNMSNTKIYDTVISFDDLHTYYETEFMFKAQAHLKKPDLIRLLSDYLRTLYIYRSRVGNLLYWRLPMYKRPIDKKTGLAMEVPPEHMYKLKMLGLYNQLQKKIDGQNRHDEMASVTPVTMDQLKAKRQKKEPPSLSVRPKLVGEKELPIYEESQALRVLKVTSAIGEVLLQRPKLYRLSQTHKPVMAMVTVILHPLMECWYWQIYMPQTQRTYTLVFYPSDLFNMSPEIYGKKSKKQGGSAIWIEMVKRSELQRNNAGDIILIIEKFKEPIKEILYQDHVYNENAQDMFFMEVVMKQHGNFVTEISKTFAPMDAFSQKLNELTIIVRAFSLTRNVWIKDTMPLSDLIKILKKENYLLDNVKQLYFTMIRDAAIMLANKIIFSDEAKNTEIKKKALTYDIHDLQTSREEMERLKKQHQRDLRRKNTNKEGLTEAQQKGLKTEWRNMIDLNKIFYQSVISENPTQICTITYSDVKELFIYRLYRFSDQSNYEKRITGVEVARTCAPHYVKMMQNRMFKELGERIALYYKKDMLVASLMTYFKMQQEREQKEREEMEALEAKYKMFEPDF